MGHTGYGNVNNKGYRKGIIIILIILPSMAKWGPRHPRPCLLAKYNNINLKNGIRDNEWWLESQGNHNNNNDYDDDDNSNSIHNSKYNYNKSSIGGNINAKRKNYNENDANTNRCSVSLTTPAKISLISPPISPPMHKSIHWNHGQKRKKKKKSIHPSPRPSSPSSAGPHYHSNGPSSQSFVTSWGPFVRCLRCRCIAIRSHSPAITSTFSLALSCSLASRPFSQNLISLKGICNLIRQFVSASEGLLLALRFAMFGRFGYLCYKEPPLARRIEGAQG